MARVSDPAFAGPFSAATFRSAIRKVMVMGMPEAIEEQATFRWSPQSTYNPQDPTHDPYTWSQTATTSVTHADVIVPVAVAFTARPSQSIDTPLGEFDNTIAVITVLDVDYALVQGADLIVLGGDTYKIMFVAPPIGLFEVTVYQIHAQARDEA